LTTALQGWATEVLRGVPKGATYDETLEALEDHFEEKHLAVAYRRAKNKDPGCGITLPNICHSHRTAGPPRLPCTTRVPYKEGSRKGVLRRCRRPRHKNPARTGRTENGERGCKAGPWARDRAPSSQAAKKQAPEHYGEPIAPPVTKRPKTICVLEFGEPGQFWG
jgi:hypothetical protein